MIVGGATHLPIEVNAMNRVHFVGYPGVFTDKTVIPPCSDAYMLKGLLKENEESHIEDFYETVKKASTHFNRTREQHHLWCSQDGINQFGGTKKSMHLR